MHTTAAWKEKLRIESVFRLVESIPREEAELRSHFARYLTVLVSGYLEVAIVGILLDYSQSSSDVRVSRYVESQLDWFQNPNPAKLKDLFSVFDPTWRRLLEENLDERRTSALTSVYAIRNKVAHGESSEITPARIREYAVSIYEIVEFVDRLCFESH